jgi:hypothetical protein
MIEGSCHCGEVRWTLADLPQSATACSCTRCRRVGGLWAYAYENEDAHVTGDTRAYVWGDRQMESHFCARCGCVAYARVIAPNADGRRRLSLNLRLADPDQVAAIPVRRFDGFDTWKEVPAHGRVVADVWY